MQNERRRGPRITTLHWRCQSRHRQGADGLVGYDVALTQRRSRVRAPVGVVPFFFPSFFSFNMDCQKKFRAARSFLFLFFLHGIASRLAEPSEARRFIRGALVGWNGRPRRPITPRASAPAHRQGAHDASRASITERRAKRGLLALLRPEQGQLSAGQTTNAA